MGSSGTASALPPRLVSEPLEARRAVTSGRIRVVGINSARGGENVRNARLVDGDVLTFGLNSQLGRDRVQGERKGVHKKVTNQEEKEENDRSVCWCS